MKNLSGVIFAALLCCGLSPAFGVGSGASCGRCDIPHPNEYYYVHGAPPMTTSDAASVCSENLSDLPLGLDYSGYVIKWVGGESPSPGSTQGFSCAACVSNHISGDGGTTQPPFTIDQSIWMALEAYPGEVSKVEYFTTDQEIEGLGASYEITVVNPTQGRSAVVRIDPYTGEVAVVQEASASHQ